MPICFFIGNHFYLEFCDTLDICVMVSVVQVEEFGEEFDATRSTGYLCAATVKNFEQVRTTGELH